MLVLALVPQVPRRVFERWGLVVLVLSSHGAGGALRSALARTEKSRRAFVIRLTDSGRMVPQKRWITLRARRADTSGDAARRLALEGLKRRPPH
jgi:hypothetical protein